MNLTRRSLVVGATIIAASGALAETQTEAEAGAAAPSDLPGGAVVTLRTETLHGYGALTARLTATKDKKSSITHIRCESFGKALLTQAKYLSDLEQLPGLRKAGLTHGNITVQCRQTGAGEVIACFARGSDVTILVSADRRGLHNLLGAAAPPGLRAEDFTTRVAVPMWLDRWDKYGLLCYFDPNARPAGTSDQDGKYDDADSLKFAREHAPLGLVPWSNPLVDDHAEGLTNESNWAWMQESARKMGIPVHVNTQISPPQLWLSNRYREQTMLKAPQFLGGYYGVAHDSAVVGAISWVAEEAEDALLGVFQHTVRRFAPDPNIVGWLEPHGETGQTPQKFFLESGSYADRRMQEFLRERYGSPAKLGESWYGDPGHYKTWNDVHIPEVAEFAGFGPDAIDLRGEWRVRYLTAPDGRVYTRDEARRLPSPPPAAPTPPEWRRPDFDDSGWDVMTAPGNDHMLDMPWGPKVYRRTVTVSAEWLTGNPQVTLTIWDMMSSNADVTTVYVNGAAATGQSHLSRDQHWSEFDVSGLLHPGSNQLTLEMPRGIICYRAYLTKAPPRQYPHLGPHLNTMWVDFVNWNTESRGAQIRRGAEMIRQIDPDRSISFMAANDYFEPIRKICRDYGGRFHDTGSMAGYWTEWNTLIMTGARLPVTAEAGNGAPNQREFQLFWGRWLTEGLNGVHYFQNWGEIAWNPEVLPVFEKYLAIYQKVGKYHSPFASVGILFSMENDYLTGFPWTPDRAESHGGENSLYNAAAALLPYCPREGICAPDFLSSEVDRYRAIIDTNTQFMREEIVAGIERYVRNGGVFITYGETGRHTPVMPDSWPISKLTGFDVTHVYGWGDNKSFSAAPGQSLLDAGAIPPQTRALGLGLQPRAPECRKLAVWDDGATAIGLRPLGKGYVVHLGPQIRNEGFVAVIDALFKHFNIRDRVPAFVPPRRGLHMRHFIGNTGLHDVWMIFNESDQPATTTLTFLPGFSPSSLLDVVTGERPTIVRAASGDTIPGIALARWESRMYLSPRRGAATSPMEWLTLQAGWHQGAMKPPSKRLPAPAEMQRFTLDLTDGWTYRDIRTLDDAHAAALAAPDIDDSKWERRSLELWLSPGDLGEKRHLVRRKFTVPAHWTAGVITLCADLPGLQFEYDTRLFLDGVAWADGRRTVDGPYSDEMNGALKPGSTHLLALDIRGKSSLTGSRGPMWLTYLPDPNARQDLSGAWTAHSDALQSIGEVMLPGVAHGASFSRAFAVNAAHASRNVVFYFEAPGDRYSIMINGRRLNSSELIRSRCFSFNITPFINFGANSGINSGIEDANLIEILSSGVRDRSIPVVEIRYYEKGVYP